MKNIEQNIMKNPIRYLISQLSIAYIVKSFLLKSSDGVYV